MTKAKHPSVKLGSRNQVVIPEQARTKLGLKVGDELLMLVKDDRIVLMPRPKHFTSELAGLYKEIWRDSDDYLDGERSSW